MDQDSTGILELFASLVRFESGKKTEWIKDPAIYDSLPSLFINFASKSRVDSGYRLLMRCVRHSFDSRTPPLDDKTAMLILHGDEVGIHQCGSQKEQRVVCVHNFPLLFLLTLLLFDGLAEHMLLQLAACSLMHQLLVIFSITLLLALRRERSGNNAFELLPRHQS